jgi:hypothetical protein
MSERLVSDELWYRVEPVIPVWERRHRYPGRSRQVNLRTLGRSRTC